MPSSFKFSTILKHSLNTNNILVAINKNSRLSSWSKIPEKIIAINSNSTNSIPSLNLAERQFLFTQALENPVIKSNNFKIK